MNNMNVYVKVGDKRYPAAITGRLHDSDWNDRNTKAIKLKMTYAEALSTFVDNVKWSILCESELPVVKNNDIGEEIQTIETVIEEIDNSEYCMAGDIIDHRDGYVTVKMGKLTDLEIALELLLVGGN